MKDRRDTQKLLYIINDHTIDKCYLKVKQKGEKNKKGKWKKNHKSWDQAVSISISQSPRDNTFLIQKEYIQISLGQLNHTTKTQLPLHCHS